MLDHHTKEPMLMNENVGDTDRVIRVVAGVAILCLFFLLQGDARWIALLGIVPLATGVIRWCPAYRLFGFTTGKRARTAG
jgi:hypothetical protein